MKFFVTGVGGQLGHDVMNELLKRGHEGVGSDIQENYSGVSDGSAVTKAPYVALDITNKNAVEKVITEVNPDAVIHCAAWTAVDMAEDDDKVTKVRAINAGGTQNIADVCKKLNCKMTYISTDYVFDGQGTEPWQPDCKDYKPLNVYGQTKLEGELAVSQTLEKYFIAVLISTIDCPVMRQINVIPARIIVVHTIRLNGSIVNVVLIDQFEFPVISKFHFTLTAFCCRSCFLNGCRDICRFCFHWSRKNPDSTKNHGNTQG